MKYYTTSKTTFLFITSLLIVCSKTVCVAVVEAPGVYPRRVDQKLNMTSRPWYPESMCPAELVNEQLLQSANVS